MRKSSLNLKSLRLLPSGSRLSFLHSSSSTASLSSTLTSSSSSSASSIPSSTSPRPVPANVLTISALAHFAPSPSPSPPILESEEDQRLQLHLSQMLDSSAVPASRASTSISAASAAAAIAAAAAALEGGMASSASDHLNRHSTMSVVESNYSYDTASSPPGSPVFSPAGSVVSRASTFYYTDQFGIPGQATTTTAIPINLIFSRQRRRAAPNFRSRFPVRVRGESL